MNLFLKLSFFDFFNIYLNPQTCLTTKYTSSPSNLYIYFCLFLNIKDFTNNGGVINLINQPFNLLIEHTSFIYCFSSYFGGAIYINCPSNGNIVLNKICSSFCSVSIFPSSLYTFSYIKSNFTNNYWISINKCGYNSTYNQGRTFTIETNNQNFYKMNISYNNLYQHSGFDSYCSNEVNISFIYIYNNFVTNEVTNFFPNGKRNIKNFLNINCSSPNGWGIFAIAHGSINYFDNCIFINNSNVLFSITDTSMVSIINSIISHNINSYGNIYHLNSNNFYLITEIKTFKH